MAHYNTVFRAVQRFMPRHDFENIEGQIFDGSESRKFSNWAHFTFMLNAHLQEAKSLRDALVSFNAQSEKHYHLGVPNAVCRSTVSDANRNRSHLLYQKIFEHLQRTTLSQFASRFTAPFKIMDSTEISDHGRASGNLKVHVVLDMLNAIPLSVEITDSKIGDITVAKQKQFSPGDVVVMDRGYFAAEKLENINKTGAFFIVRMKAKVHDFTHSRELLDAKNVKEDCRISFSGSCGEKYSGPLRKIRIHDDRKNEDFDVITNILDLPAESIASLYKSRWQIEIFFKWLKQNSKLKTIFAYDANGIKIQIWTALICYLLLWVMARSTEFTDLLMLRRIIKARLFDPEDTLYPSRRPGTQGAQILIFPYPAGQ